MNFEEKDLFSDNNDLKNEIDDEYSIMK